ncbi:calcium/sodium antiporter [Halomonas urumqiensis]|uniref:Sodium:calcium antiporter n=1 Tax=Halomonas urumqiensis TaxID=1684789 RepID=A0A2N7UDB6_9GAMM|nr:calcium/sodium antiporter [Halomonas urumqiensis]PMR78456.1 sodium:calcium antiporter [Halomonas urumqiensis]PTB03601.1 sodium:calcium antiporter [Halomonas urumqiensis]GHE20193.1 sodium:calcium antiporter [Halomonas urumqiensis]
MTIAAFIAGLVLLIVGAEALVRGASRLAARAGISPLIIGLTVVAFGTSSPELAVSLKAAMDDQAGIAMGNVVGSNIFNVLFILGVSALIVPLAVAQQLVRIDIPLMIGLSVLVLLLALDGGIGHLDGLVLVGGLAAYLTFLLFQNRRNPPPTEPNTATGDDRHWAINLAMVVGGLVLLVLGSRWFVEGAVAFANYLGVSDQVIGLTIIAAGTSLPEVVTSIIAALRGERDIAVGNVVGSNVFNILGVLGLTGLLAPSGIAVSEAMLGFDLLVMIAVALACLPVCFTGGTISRWEGGVLLGYYVAYTLYLVLAATHHDALAGFSTAMLYFVLPLTVLTLVVLTVQERYRARRA